MGKLRFGKDENTECIVDVGLKGPNDEPLCLGHKWTTHWFGAGVWVKDDGYVLLRKGRTDTYFALPAGAELASLQAQGGLPQTLPAYRIPTLDYVFGYSLWIVIGGVLAFEGLKHLLSRPSASPTGVAQT